MNPKLTDVKSINLWKVCCTLEAAHEHDDLEVARKALLGWDITLEEAYAELEARGVI